MNDAEINLAIAQIEYPNDSWRMTHGDGVATIAGQDLIVKDYCNDWADIGPIIEREKITVDFWDDKQWMAHNNRDTPFVKARAETPTKAATLCFLKMKGM